MEKVFRIIKKCTPFILALMFALHYQPVEAQILKKLKKRVEKAAEETVIKKIEDKTSKETGKVMDTILDSKGDNGKTTKEADKPTPKIQEKLASNSIENKTTSELKPWSKYNFVPGDKVIFHDDLMDEESGEFPSRWDLIKGNAENASFEGEMVINMDYESIVTPLMETNEYLPEVFTIEFDAYYDQEFMPSYVYHQIYKLRFWDGPKHGELPDKKGSYQPLKVYRYGASLSGNINGQPRDYKGFEESMKSEQPLWRHIAISFNKRSLKIFVDQYRALNIPNLGFQPKQISIEGYSNKHAKEDGFIIAIKNIRIAEGGKKLYERVMADGKFVTRGILFDINKATIKPESMGVLNKVAKMMQEHPDLNFRIEGHTDSDGADDYNLELSEQRAASVKEALISIGIDAPRMETKGLGESVPVSDNSSPEGKANNRRVEFIKI